MGTCPCCDPGWQNASTADATWCCWSVRPRVDRVGPNVGASAAGGIPDRGAWGACPPSDCAAGAAFSLPLCSFGSHEGFPRCAITRQTPERKAQGSASLCSFGPKWVRWRDVILWVRPRVHGGRADHQLTRPPHWSRGRWSGCCRCHRHLGIGDPERHVVAGERRVRDEGHGTVDHVGQRVGGGQPGRTVEDV